LRDFTEGTGRVQVAGTRHAARCLGAAAQTASRYSRPRDDGA
jgi:hypothetical protein